MKTIAILGGKGGFGAWIAKQIQQEYRHIDLLCTHSSAENIFAVEKADIVIIAVPIHQTEKTIREIGSFVQKDAIVFDVTSIKEKPVQWMKKYLPTTCTIIPTHPMFGPSLSLTTGQVIVLTPDTKTMRRALYKQFKIFLEKRGLQIVETTPQKHDAMMATIQGLTHLTLFVMGETMRKMKVDITLAEKFISPIYKLMTSSIARYIHQNPSLYADIQMNNPHMVHIHATFNAVAQQFTRMVEQKNKRGFVNVLQKTKQFFGDDAEKGQHYTDKILFLLAKQRELLAAQKGKHIVCEHIYTKEKKHGLLSGYTNTDIILDDHIHIASSQRIVLS